MEEDPETPEARFARLLPPNATVLDRAVLAVLLDPWTYLGYLMCVLTPLILLSAYAHWTLMKDEAREKWKRRKERKERKRKAARRAGGGADAGLQGRGSNGGKSDKSD